MDRMKNIIIFMIVTISLLSIIALIAVISLKKRNESSIHHIPKENEIDTQGDIGEFFEVTNEEVNVDNMSKVKTVESIIQRYFDTININSTQYYGKNENEEYIRITSDQEIKNNILEMLSEEYKSLNDINEENLNNKVTILSENLEIIALQMKEIINDRIDKYCVNAIAISDDYKIKDKFCIFVNLDYKNNTFSIEPINDTSKSYDDIKIINKNMEIKKLNYNQYKSLSFGHEQTINKYMNDFKKISLSDSNITYKLLDEEYKNEKFKNETEFSNYIIKNKNRFEKLNLIKYRVSYFDNYLEFIGIDENNFYYIFKQKKNDPLNYTVILDTYTIDQSEFIEKYDKGNNQQKVGMNIEKIVSAINCKDYDYIYNKLDETFKETYFKNINQLEELLKNNLFDINKVTYEEFSEMGEDIYTYNIIIYSTEETEASKKITVVLKLLENRDFVFSFSFD